VKILRERKKYAVIGCEAESSKIAERMRQTVHFPQLTSTSTRIQNRPESTGSNGDHTHDPDRNSRNRVTEAAADLGPSPQRFPMDANGGFNNINWVRRELMIGMKEGRKKTG
jgi:hypothetical protein